MTRQDDVEEMAHTMEAACCCEIVLHDTLVIDADWGKFHNPWENARPRRSSAGAKTARLTRFVDRMYVCARACPFGVHLAFHL